MTSGFDFAPYLGRITAVLTEAMEAAYMAGAAAERADWETGAQNPEEIDMTQSIDAIGLPYPLDAHFISRDITRLEELTALTEDEVLKLGVGKLNLETIIKILARMKLTLRK